MTIGTEVTVRVICGYYMASQLKESLKNFIGIVYFIFCFKSLSLKSRSIYKHNKFWTNTDKSQRDWGAQWNQGQTQMLWYNSLHISLSHCIILSFPLSGSLQTDKNLGSFNANWSTISKCSETWHLPHWRALLMHTLVFMLYVSGVQLVMK